MSGRPNVCFVAPGHTLVGTAGSARNVLATAEAMSKFADVTVAFRSNNEGLSPATYRIIEIAGGPSNAQARDDVGARGLNPLAHLSYLRELRKFAQELIGKYDLVLEKGWRLSGYLCRELTKYGMPTMLVENDARIWNDRISSPRMLLKFLAHIAAQRMARRASQAAPLVVAETQELKDALVACRGLQTNRVKVVPLGVDQMRFRPMDQAEARNALSINKSALVMMYVGGMDCYHDISPLLSVVDQVKTKNVEVHLVGDGNYRAKYENLSRGLSVPVRFHGQVNHEQIPQFIAAADVCLAPYDATGFYHNKVAFSTLKIPEYMACAKPVISIPSGNIKSLIKDGETGFLFDNESEQWRRFLEAMPSRETLALMGRAAAPTISSLTWETTAKKYLQLSSEIADKQLYCEPNAPRDEDR